MLQPIPEKVKKMKENPDKTVEELEDEAALIAEKKAAQEAAKASKVAASASFASFSASSSAPGLLSSFSEVLL